MSISSSLGTPTLLAGLSHPVLMRELTNHEDWKDAQEDASRISQRSLIHGYPFPFLPMPPNAGDNRVSFYQKNLKKGAAKG